MLANRTRKARHDAHDCHPQGSGIHTAPRAAFFWRLESAKSIGFALTLLLLSGFLPAVGFRNATAAPARAYFDQHLDHDRNQIEDLLDQWRLGRATWRDLELAAHADVDAGKVVAQPRFPGGLEPLSSVVAAGRVRVLCLGATAGQLAAARLAGNVGGTCALVQDITRFGGVTVLAVDAVGLENFLGAGPDCAVMLDREGVPALVDSRHLVGVGRVTAGLLDLGNDWSATVAILDSGMDSAHGDLGDTPDDDIDGPAPAVGDAGDWLSAAGGWPLFAGYKAVGWHDVTDDFPESQGPWDYHYHGTALASVVAGSGAVDPDYRGLAPGGRLTIVKYYDFDQTWHAWAGDFLAACAWTLDNRATYRVRTVLMAANWEVDAGISAAMAAFVDAGVLPVAAMGNYGSDSTGPYFPASVADVLTVGAANSSGAVSAFSGRGVSGGDKPDLVAPGGGLLPAMGRIVAADNEPNDSYSGRSGTSLGAAHVAGAAFVLDEALLENGLAPATDRAGVTARQTVLKMTTAQVAFAETPDGSDQVSLPPYTGHDPSRGFGLLRVDAAVHAMIDPLRPGQDQADTLSSDWQKPVVARRLSTTPGVRYLVEAVPASGLDVSLEVVEVGGDGQIVRMNLNGAGVSEFGYFRPSVDSWSFLVVKRLAGAGGVTLRLREEDSFNAQGSAQVLPGIGFGAPNMGYLAPFDGPSLLIPSRVLVDPVANSLNVLGPTGEYRPGWPVFVFPASASQGGLTQPMAVNLDGVPGDEIVVASDFGSVYFFTGSGMVKTVDLELNRALTRPVGLKNAVGGWRVLVVDKLGWVRSWSWNAAVDADPELESEIFLGHELPLAPAVGQLTADTGESAVVAFADGWLGVLDENLDLRGGWPRDLGGLLETAPVLCDLDRDGLHEIVVPVRDENSGRLTMRVFDGAGNPLAADGQIVPAPQGGSWLAISQAAVSGWYGAGDVSVTVAGLADNGLAGDRAAWCLGVGRLQITGTTDAVAIPGFSVRGSTAEGVLQLDKLLLPSPLAWNWTGSPGTEVTVLFHIRWDEQLYGFTAIPGGTSGWLMGTERAAPLSQKQPLTLGGSQQPALANLGSMLVPLEDGVLLRVETFDRKVGITPVRSGTAVAPLWRSERGDQRNSGAYPLQKTMSAVGPGTLVVSGLRVSPNPGNGRVRFRGQGGELSAETQVDIFDLRGCRLRTLAGADGNGVVLWDGMDERGRPVAAGTYLAVARTGGQRLTTRLVLTR